MSDDQSEDDTGDEAKRESPIGVNTVDGEFDFEEALRRLKKRNNLPRLEDL